MKSKIDISFILLFILSLFLIHCAGKKPDTLEKEPIKIYNSEAIRHYMNGEIYSLHGDWAMAAIEYQDAARFDSTSTTIYASIGNAFLNLGKLDNAEVALMTAVELDSCNYIARKQLADIKFTEGNFETVEKEYNFLAAKLTENIDIDYKLADIYLRTKRIAEALEKYENIFRKDRTQLGALERAGEILFLSKNFNKAAQYFDFLVQLDPNNTEYLKTSADLAILTQNIDKAIVLYNRLIQLLPDDPQIEENLGEILSQVREEKYQPEEFLKNLIHKYPENVENYKNLAYYLVNNNRLDEALQLLLSVKVRFAQDPDLFFILGSLYHEKGDRDEALFFLDSALMVTDDSLQVLHLKATIYEESGQFSSSDSLYNFMIRQNPDDPVALNNYAYSLATRGDNLEKAHEMVTRALEIVPNNASYLDTKGWILYKKGNFKEAEEYLVKALNIIGENAEILEHLGDVLSKLGKIDEAQRHYQKALELDPRNELLQEKILR
ncbi:MAG: tetratricopeptide repeat protein [Candidatus Marinimicrobia bacterium]|nr:tetratricopeptide repeat protein [Candidatus Neomarinimicrobiota bacterium]